MKTYHILNGDCLAEKFPKLPDGEIIIWREGLVEGPLPERDFFKAREDYISSFVDNSGYQLKVVSEFKKIQNIPEGSEVYFWFEDDLFCQVNFWFLVSELKQKPVSKYRVFPKNHLTGFANSDQEELLHLLGKAQFINDSETELISILWKDYQNKKLRKEYPTSEILRNLPDLLVANETVSMAF